MVVRGNILVFVQFLQKSCGAHYNIMMRRVIGTVKLLYPRKKTKFEHTRKIPNIL